MPFMSASHSRIFALKGEGALSVDAHSKAVRQFFSVAFGDDRDDRFAFATKRSRQRCGSGLASGDALQSGPVSGAVLFFGV